MHNEQYPDWQVQTFKFQCSDRIYRFLIVGADQYYFDASGQSLSANEMKDIGYTKV